MPTDLRDRLPIAAYIFSPMGVLVNAASPYRTLRDLIEAAGAEPGKITYGSGGVGTSPQLLAEDFASRIGATLLSVPFRGAGEAAQALMAGTIDMLIASPATALGNLGPGGRLRRLAVGSERRLPLLPDVPTFAEAGVTGFVVSSWISFFAPGGTPVEVTDRLAREVVNYEHS
ncbi:MAG: tripartite tricarboxylate transporter substrate binding protein [Acetobacteraceae bacterium]|nr:tripartite tricarboxylate transporter substrate binding protein [Acetobacteraceae bacterium]